MQLLAAQMERFWTRNSESAPSFVCSIEWIIFSACLTGKMWGKQWSFRCWNWLWKQTDETHLSLRQRQMHIHLSLSKIPHLPKKLNQVRSPLLFRLNSLHAEIVCTLPFIYAEINVIILRSK